jgi:hypothetical protein
LWWFSRSVGAEDAVNLARGNFEVHARDSDVVPEYSNQSLRVYRWRATPRRRTSFGAHVPFYLHLVLQVAVLYSFHLPVKTNLS